MTYSDLEIDDVAVDDLHLDVGNYRFPVARATEAEAMGYLYENHDVLDIASAIIRDGYVDNELPMVIVEDGRYVVLEGNRRISALRGLLAPELVPSHQAELERLRGRYPLEADRLPRRIRAMLFPDRDAAVSVLARLHIGDSKKAWSLDEQAKFVLAQLADGATAKELRERFPVIKSVVRLVRMNSAREMLITTDLGDPDLNAYAASSSLAMSAFEYAYRNADIRALVGMGFATNGQLDARPSTPAQIRALARLVRGFQTEELSTRQGFKKGSKELRQLLRDLRAEAEKPNDARRVESADEGVAPEDAGSQGSGSTASGGNESLGSQTPDPDPRGPNSPDTKAKLDFAGIDESALPVNLKHRLLELRRIKVTEFPAASAILMRSVLEAVIKEHYSLTRPQEATGMLSDVMVKVTADYQGERHLSYSIGTINRTKGRDSATPGTGTWFNFVTHSVNVAVKGEQVHDAWRVVAPLVRFLLNHSPAEDPVE